MAEPYLTCPQSWHHGTLEPNRDSGLILSVDTGSTPMTSYKEYWEGNLYWLTPKEVTRLNQLGQLYVSSTDRTITQIGLSSFSGKLLPPNTVMLTKRAPVGAVAINTVPMSTNQGFLNFTCGSKLRPTYLAYWLLINKPYLEKIANGSTYPELYKSDLFEFEISFPPVEVQDKMLQVVNSIQFLATVCSPVEQSSHSLPSIPSMSGYTKRLTNIRDKILPLLFSGYLETEQVHQILMEKDYD